MSVHEKLLKIQSSLNVPKSQYNTFGKYNYRSCEDILSALKPFLKETKCIVTVNDDLIMIGARYYIKATAKLVDCETGEEVSNTAYAREEDSKKGMDSSQVTGATSSYARKYALNGLFLLDDMKDADANENQEQTRNAAKNNNRNANENQEQTRNTAKSNNGNVNTKAENTKADNGKAPGAPKTLIDQKTLEVLRKRFADNGIDERKVCSLYKVAELSKMTWTKYQNAISHFEKLKEQCAA